MSLDHLIGIEPVRAQPISAEKLAVNAVMAGCLPMHFPVVATAWQAAMRDEFLLHGVTSSTGGCAVLVIINGPIRREIGANPTFNVLGNSDRATAAIGRAMRLALINLMDYRPLNARPSRQVLLLPRRGRGGHDMAAAVGRARHASKCVGRHRHGGHGAAPDHERVDHGPEGDPRDVRG
jgi:hypothetical protein